MKNELSKPPPWTIVDMKSLLLPTGKKNKERMDKNLTAR